VTTDPGRLTMVLDPYLMPVLDLSETRTRLTLNPDGSMTALVGGYQPWRNLYYGFADQGHIKEYAASIDVPAVYYALKRNADWDPDPKTGENRQISSAYAIEAVSAFVVPAGGDKTAEAR
jgi:hypothetical protein